MKDIEIISDITNIRVKVFTHNDLDGVSCALALKRCYDLKRINFDFTFMSYNDISSLKTFIDINNEDGIKKYDYVFITDINIASDNFHDYIQNPLRVFNAKLNDPARQNTSLFKKMFIIDHHKDSEKTFRNRVEEFFPIIEYYNDMTNCAALQVFNFIESDQSREWARVTLGIHHPMYEDRKVWLRSYLEHVHNWDTFEWKNNGDIVARDLNLVFSNTKRSKFFVDQEQKNGLAFYFNKSEIALLNEVLEKIEKDYQKALATSVVLDHINEFNVPYPDIQYIVIRSDENVSLICDKLKEDIINKKIYSRFNIKYIANISFKYGSISFRRIYDDIDLSKIANIYGGGGHEFAAGCVLDGKNPLQMQRLIVPTLEKYGEPIKL